MAQITGSSTIDWSSVTLEPIDFEQQFNDFSSRIDQVVMEIETGQFFFNSPPTDTFISLTLFSGGLLTVAGSGLQSDFPVINSFDFNNPSTGDVARFAGTLDFVGKEFFNSMTIGVPGLKLTMIGNIVEDSLGNTSGSITQLKVKVGSIQLTIKGNLVVDANFDFSGTVTQISVLSGTNSILMSGLSLPYSALDSVTTFNDLFAVVGNQLAGNDTITYTNNSSVGMTFFGGAGNDTFTISGPNADTLNGGDGNDTYVHVAGGASDSFIENTGEGSDTIRAAVTFTLPDASQNIENLTLTGIGNIDGTGNTLNNVLTGNSGNNVLSGGDGADQLNGGAGADILQGEAGDDLVLLASAAQFAVGEVIDGGTQDLTGDTLRFTSTVAGTLTLTANVIDVERVELANAAGLTTGLAAINVNAAAVTSNGMTLVGNNGANVLTGTAQADTLTGNGGNDRLNGGADDDTLNGGNGSDVILIGTAGDHGVGETINGDAGVDVIRFTSVTGGEELTLSAGVTVESVVIANAAGVTTGTTALDVDASAVVSNGLTLIGNAGVNTLTGTGLNDVLKGAGGSDTLRGGLGNDTVNGGGGNDTFLFGSGDGQDLVKDISGSADKMLFDVGIDPLDLVISRQANDLRLAIHGSSDQVTVQNWYTSSVNRTETIQAGNGQTLLSTQVNQLIQAMAGFTQQTGLSWDAASGGAGDPGQQTQFQSIVAANWQ